MKFSEYELKNQEQANFNDSKLDIKMLESQYDNMKNLSKNELDEKLKSEVEKLRESGQFDKEKLFKQIDNFSAILSEEQIIKMKNMLKNL